MLLALSEKPYRDDSGNDYEKKPTVETSDMPSPEDDGMY